uniref:X8 domain-containing protein n=1 Tax=Zea mays TaxID=4577 RepID=B6U893_MAIZE|nr:hypothetical protein [Zea mays]
MAAPLFLLLLLLAMFTGSADAAFCVCKTGVPDQAMQAAIDYACAKGADCASASKGAPCYGNGNKVAVCSYICNSYYQSRSATGATCDFNGVAMATGSWRARHSQTGSRLGGPPARALVDVRR